MLVLVLMVMAVSHLHTCSTAPCCEPPAAAHETESTKVGDLERSELTGDLPVLRHKEYGCPGELESRP